MQLEQFDIIRNTCGIIKNIIFFVEKASEIRDDFREFYSDLNLYFYSHENSLLCLVKKNNLVKYTDINSLNPEETIYFISEFDDDSVIKKLKKYIYHITGSINDTKVDYFLLWEILQEHAHNIFINFNIHGTWRDLNWKRNGGFPEISIIIPVFNMEKYLHNCFETLMAWDAPYIEFLAVNDGSTDKSLKILQDLAQKDSRIKIINKANGGCASARQKGLEVAQACYVGFIDPDDYISPNMFRELMRAMLFGPFDVAFCGYTKYFEHEPTKSFPAQEEYLKWYQQGTYNKNDIKKLLVQADIGIWRGIYRKDFLEHNNISFNIDLRRYDDLPFQKEVFLKAASFVTVNKPMYFYRLGRPGQDVLLTCEKIFIHFEIFSYLDEIFTEAADEEACDYLTIIKINTHKWALEKIDDKLFKRYKKLALKDVFSKKSIIYTLIHTYMSAGMYGLKMLMSLTLMRKKKNTR